MLSGQDADRGVTDSRRLPRLASSSWSLASQLALTILGSGLASIIDWTFVTLQNPRVEALTPMELYLEIGPGGGSKG